MPSVYSYITVDVLMKNTFDPILAKQGDEKSRYIVATFTEEGKKISIESGAVITLSTRLQKDATRSSSTGTVNATDGSVTVELTSSMLVKDGYLECEISAAQAGSVLTCMSFQVDIQSSTKQA